jgi:hypothetical protein
MDHRDAHKAVAESKDINLALFFGILEDDVKQLADVYFNKTKGVEHFDCQPMLVQCADQDTDGASGERERKRDSLATEAKRSSGASSKISPGRPSSTPHSSPPITAEPRSCARAREGESFTRNHSHRGSRAAPAHGLCKTALQSARQINNLHREDFLRTLMRGSPDGTVEPDRYRQEMMMSSQDLAAERDRAT